MKIASAQLEQHLKTTLAPIYILSGEEILLKQDVMQLIRKQAKAADFSERLRISPDAGFDWEEFYSILYSTSLLAEKRLIELDLRHSNPTKTAATILQTYGENPVADNILLIDIGKLDDKITRSAWYKALDKKGIVIPIWPIPREQLPQWIMNRAKKYKLTMQQDAASLLADYIEGNLSAAAQTIEKLYLLKPQAAIDITLIQNLLNNESRFTVFDLVEQLLSGDMTRTLHVLHTLKEDGLEAILVLWAITRELRLLVEMSEQLQSGIPMDALLQKNRIFAKRQLGVKRFLRSFSKQQALDLLKQAGELDKMMKGISAGDAWLGLDIFCLRFSM